MAPTYDDKGKSESQNENSESEITQENENPHKKPRLESQNENPPARPGHNVFIPKSPPTRHTLPSNIRDPSTPSSSTQPVVSYVPTASSITSKPHIGSADSGQPDVRGKCLFGSSGSKEDLTVQADLHKEDLTVQADLHKEDLTVQADLQIKNGEYVLKLTNVPIPTDMKREEVLAKNGALLLHQAEIIRNLGEQMLSQFQRSFEYKILHPPNLTQ